MKRRLIGGAVRAGVFAAVLGGIVAPGIALAAGTSTKLCIPQAAGKPVLTPTSAGKCKTYYTLTAVNPAGPTGATGSQGAQGEKGATGSQGAQGVQGASGPTGAQGPQGEKGATGGQGAQGVQGATGPTGAQGPQGEKGATGGQGEKGTTGATGVTGTSVAGATGAEGKEGREGKEGSRGPTGATGAAGKSVITRENIVTVKPGASATTILEIASIAKVTTGQCVEGGNRTAVISNIHNGPANLWVKRVNATSVEESFVPNWTSYETSATSNEPEDDFTIATGTGGEGVIIEITLHMARTSSGCLYAATAEDYGEVVTKLEEVEKKL